MGSSSRQMYNDDGRRKCDVIMVGDGEKMGCGDSSTSRCVPGIFF